MTRDLPPHCFHCLQATMASSARRGGSILTQYFLFILLGFGVVTLWMNWRHEGINPIQVFQNQHFSSIGLTYQAQRLPPREDAAKAEEIDAEEESVQKDGEFESNKSEASEAKKDTRSGDVHQEVEKGGHANNADAKDEEAKDEGHKLAGLDCTKYGGPSNEIAAGMVYWSDIPSDNAHVSPFYSPDRYMTFEPDHGGWNNIRMSMETVLAMAHAMGRTLVLPPEQGMYLLGKDKGAVSNMYACLIQTVASCHHIRSHHV